MKQYTKSEILEAITKVTGNENITLKVVNKKLRKLGYNSAESQFPATTKNAVIDEVRLGHSVNKLQKQVFSLKRQLNQLQQINKIHDEILAELEVIETRIGETNFILNKGTGSYRLGDDPHSVKWPKAPKSNSEKKNSTTCDNNTIDITDDDLPF